MRTIVARAMLALVGAVAFPVHAQVKVFVSSTAPDSVGNRLAYAVKEAIRRSSGMQLADREEDALISLSIVTLDPDKNYNESNRTIYSAVWTVQTFHSTPVSMYLTNSVGICGTGRVSQCADGLAADTDAKISSVRSLIRDIDKKN